LYRIGGLDLVVARRSKALQTDIMEEWEQLDHEQHLGNNIYILSLQPDKPAKGVAAHLNLVVDGFIAAVTAMKWALMEDTKASFVTSLALTHGIWISDWEIFEGFFDIHPDNSQYVPGWNDYEWGGQRPIDACLWSQCEKDDFRESSETLDRMLSQKL